MNASTNLLHRLSAATVGISAQIPESHPSTVVLGAERQGSGVMLDGEHLVLTVNYVVLGATSLTVTLTNGSERKARVVAQDFITGVALLDIGSSNGFGVVARHSNEVTAGWEVVLVASTGKEDRRVSDGLITSLAPFDANWEFSLDRALATTAQSPGFGGAPICDLEGRVLGITFLDAGEVGRFTLGIPVDHVLDHRDELLRDGRRTTRPMRAWIGCFCYTIREHVVIAGVMPGGPAALAGLQAGDVVLALDQQQVSDRHELYTTLWAQPPGGRIELRVYRDNGVREITITTGNAEEFFS